MKFSKFPIIFPLFSVGTFPVLAPLTFNRESVVESVSFEIEELHECYRHCANVI
jgi:hypothetical protein